MVSLQDVSDAVVLGNSTEVKDLVRQAIAGGIPPLQIIDEGLVPGIQFVGDQFETGEMFLAEMMLSAITMKAGMAVAQEQLKTGEYEPKATMVIGTVQGDLHDIGKNLVAALLECNGFEVIDLGVDVSAEKFVSAVKEHKPAFLGMSALITTCMIRMKDVIEALSEAGLRDGLRIVIGGAGASPGFASEIGADAYARNAAQGVKLCEGWV